MSGPRLVVDNTTPGAFGGRKPPEPPTKPVAMRRAAVISDNGKYRFALGRQWDEARPMITWVMLNPSTADAEQDDPTVRRCVSFSRRWGFGTLAIVNLFALRATDPKEVKRAVELDIVTAIGPQCDAAIRENTSISSAVVVAWGSPGWAVPRAVQIWLDILAPLPLPKVCLGVTDNGSPRHPLYVADDTRPLHWRMKEGAPA